MWKVLLSLIPWEVLIPWVFAKLTDLSEEFSRFLVKKAVEFVVEAEKKFGRGKGELKAKYVDEKLSEILNETSKFVINLLREFAVAYAKKEGLIK